jgi:6-phosphogluconolactonase
MPSLIIDFLLLSTTIITPVLIVALFLLSFVKSDKNFVFFIGTLDYSGQSSTGIYKAYLNHKTGKISLPTLLFASKDSSCLAMNSKRNVLYSTVENEIGKILVFLLNDKNEAKMLNVQSSNGSGPTHIAIDATNSVLLAVNYNSGTVVCLPIHNNGSVGEVSCIQQHVGDGPKKERQSSPHPHGVYIDANNENVYVADLGTDTIAIYKLDKSNGRIVKSSPYLTHVPSGSGPRHITIHPNNDFLYVCNELSVSLSVFKIIDENNGNKKLQLIQNIPIVFDKSETDNLTEQVTLAEIFCDKNGKYLYVSARGINAIIVFAISNADFKVSHLQTVFNVPATPRGFSLSPDGKWLVVAGQTVEGTLNAYKVGENTGLLQDTYQSVSLPFGCTIVFR